MPRSRSVKTYQKCFSVPKTFVKGEDSHFIKKTSSLSLALSLHQVKPEDKCITEIGPVHSLSPCKRPYFNNTLEDLRLVTTLKAQLVQVLVQDPGPKHSPQGSSHSRLGSTWRHSLHQLPPPKLNWLQDAGLANSNVTGIISCCLPTYISLF
jgi:hypothetical protein